RVGPQPQLVAGGVALWRHDWGRSWASSAGGGAFRVQRFNTGRGVWSPTPAPSLPYATPSRGAPLSYTPSITTNPLLGQTLLADDFRLRAGLPLTEHADFVLAGTAGYQVGRLIDENAELAAHVHVVMGDLMLGWQANRWLLVAVRYQHIEQ